MKVLVTGAAGFLGRRMVETILQRGTVANASGAQVPVTKIVGFDVVPLQGVSDARLEVVAGDLSDPAQIERLVDAETKAVFHFAAIVSGQAEQEFDLGMRVNFDATRALFERIRAVTPDTRLVMTSTGAVFGGDLPPVVPDTFYTIPQTSYGTQKAMTDLLVNDYSRKGFMDGRALRMPTIVVRPGKPNRAASSFASGIIREPVNGQESVCPVGAETAVWILSPEKAISNLLHAQEIPASELGDNRVLNLPGMSVTVAEMLSALRRVCGDAVADRVRIEPDPVIIKIVETWAIAYDASRALRLGFKADPDFDSIIRIFLEDNKKV